MTDNLSIDPELVKRDQIGDVFTHTDGHRYRVTKRTRTAMAVERFYFYDAWFDWIVKKLGGIGANHTDNS